MGKSSANAIRREGMNVRVVMAADPSCEKVGLLRIESRALLNSATAGEACTSARCRRGITHDLLC
jgi:hypothetical protein